MIAQPVTKEFEVKTNIHPSMLAPSFGLTKPKLLLADVCRTSCIVHSTRHTER